MAREPDHAWVAWAGEAMGGGPAEATALRADDGPWRVEAAGRTAVLRVDEHADRARLEFRALAHASEHGIPVSAPIAVAELDGRTLVLVEFVAGSSTAPRERDDARLGRVGAVAARVAALPAGADWPERRAPIDAVDFARLRRERPHPLLERAASAVDGMALADTAEGFVHGDLWQGNLLWHDGDVAAVIDWDHAGRGPSGLDLGSTRLDAALLDGAGAEDAVLAGWEDQAGRAAADVAYWDAVAALATPPDLGWFVPVTIGDTGRHDLDRALMVARRDAFLESALGRLGA